jgi:lysozyme
MALADKTKLAAVIGPAAAVLAVALTGSNEGVSLKPYNDKLGANVQTVCYGDTEVPMRRYTLDECKQLLADRLADYATAVRNSTLDFDALTDGQKIAAVDFAYNLGVQTYKSSTLRVMYGNKQFPEACDQYLRYKYTGNPRRDCSLAENHCSGLMKRRRAERAACRGE